ncbi:hypothetical protein [Desulforamulus hydrothermalis]|uniref:Uncharacterized protein n=1 Tax=Desulforamulus hydrothermalis Lam5 = DSM 18033 TaxID=1121428 RepID=K8EBH9_9FIRM|nr:hypothetical protein [Desulforamulus hydrothermalis]CCO09008.1 conserved hypothetical protein [Desulforamulus hydrothermalis Lam5 = DSM 18033]SHG76823.1 hypothetical protein SAMN02745177_00322 [Desulforamulus hydrothermalis Lam5 = DSM 18033]
MQVKNKLRYSAKAVSRYLLMPVAIPVVILLYYHICLAPFPADRLINQVGSDAQTVMQPAAVAEHVLILQLINFSTLPKAKVLVNGQVKGDFSHPYVTVAVCQGDCVEVDTTFYDHLVTIKVLDSTRQVMSPAKGAEFTGRKTVIALGHVKLAGR